MTDQNKERLFDACESGDIDTVRSIVGSDPNSVHWIGGSWNGTPLVSRARLSHGERESGQLRIKSSCCTVSSGRTVQSVDNNSKC